MHNSGFMRYVKLSHRIHHIPSMSPSAPTSIPYLSHVAPGSEVHTDEYAIYNRLEQWGFEHKTVNHGQGEFARDDDGDGFCEVHVNTIEGIWSLLRSWLRPHRGVSQEKLPLYLGFFQFVHNVRNRGRALLPALLHTLVTP